MSFSVASTSLTFLVTIMCLFVLMRVSVVFQSFLHIFFWRDTIDPISAFPFNYHLHSQYHLSFLPSHWIGARTECTNLVRTELVAPRLVTLTSATALWSRLENPFEGWLNHKLLEEFEICRISRNAFLRGCSKCEITTSLDSASQVSEVICAFLFLPFLSQ